MVTDKKIQNKKIIYYKINNKWSLDYMGFIELLKNKRNKQREKLNGKI